MTNLTTDESKTDKPNQVEKKFPFVVECSQIPNLITVQLQALQHKLLGRWRLCVIVLASVGRQFAD